MTAKNKIAIDLTPAIGCVSLFLRKQDVSEISTGIQSGTGEATINSFPALASFARENHNWWLEYEGAVQGLRVGGNHQEAGYQLFDQVISTLPCRDSADEKRASGATDRNSTESSFESLRREL